jgi:hypothetical protein
VTYITLFVSVAAERQQDEAKHAIISRQISDDEAMIKNYPALGRLTMHL